MLRPSGCTVPSWKIKPCSFPVFYEGCWLLYTNAYPAPGHLWYCDPQKIKINVVPQETQECDCIIMARKCPPKRHLRLRPVSPIWEHLRQDDIAPAEVVVKTGAIFSRRFYLILAKKWRSPIALYSRKLFLFKFKMSRCWKTTRQWVCYPRTYQ